MHYLLHISRELDVYGLMAGALEGRVCHIPSMLLRSVACVKGAKQSKRDSRWTHLEVRNDTRRQGMA